MQCNVSFPSLTNILNNFIKTEHAAISLRRKFDVEGESIDDDAANEEAARRRPAKNGPLQKYQEVSASCDRKITHQSASGQKEPALVLLITSVPTPRFKVL